LEDTTSVQGGEGKKGERETLKDGKREKGEVTKEGGQQGGPYRRAVIGTGKEGIPNTEPKMGLESRQKGGARPRIINIAGKSETTTQVGW